MIIIGKTIVILCNLFNYFDSREQTTKTSDLVGVNRADVNVQGFELIAALNGLVERLDGVLDRDLVLIKQISVKLCSDRGETGWCVFS